jgi:hypothetical protein
MDDTKVGEKMLGAWSGMFLAERAKDEEAPQTARAAKVAEALMASSPEEFHKFLAVEGRPGVPAVAVPVGLWFWNGLPDIIEFCRAGDPYLDTHGQCANIAAGIMVSSAMFDVPTGAWGNEISVVVGGIDDGLVSLVDAAADLSNDGTAPEEALAEIGSRDVGGGGAVVAAALYCCMRSHGSYKEAVETAAACPFGGSQVPALVGAAMGALHGPPFLLKSGDKPAMLSGVEALAARMASPARAGK